MPRFGEILKALREERKEKQEDLADFLGVSRGAISKYENCKREPDVQVLTALANHYDVTIDYITGKTYIRNKPDYVAENLKRLVGDRSIECFLKALKKEMGISIDREDMDNYIRGRTAPSPAILRALAEYAGVDADFFYRNNSDADFQYIKENSPQYRTKSEMIERMLKNKDFIRLAEKIIDHDLDIETIDRLIDAAVALQKKSQTSNDGSL